MSTNKKKQQVRPEQKVLKINKLAQANTGRSGKMDGLVPLYPTASLPDAALLPDGVLAFDSTLNKLKITKAGAWILAN